MLFGSFANRYHETSTSKDRKIIHCSFVQLIFFSHDIIQRIKLPVSEVVSDSGFLIMGIVSIQLLNDNIAVKPPQLPL